MFKCCDYNPDNRYFMLIGRSNDIAVHENGQRSFFSLMNVIEACDLSRQSFDDLVAAAAIYLKLYPQLRLLTITKARFEREAARSQEMS